MFNLFIFRLSKSHTFEEIFSVALSFLICVYAVFLSVFTNFNSSESRIM